MKKVLTILFVVFVFSLNAQNTKKYEVTANTLNVRSEPIKSSRVISKLKKGDIVSVIGFNGNWSIIEISPSKKGYVSSKYLVILNKQSVKKTKTKTKNNKNYLYILISIVFLIILYYRFKRRCPKCGKWGVMKVIDKELIEEKATSIKKILKEETKNAKGEVTKTVNREVVVPGTKRTYKVYRKCKKCGEIVVHLETNVEED